MSQNKELLLNIYLSQYHILKTKLESKGITFDPDILKEFLKVIVPQDIDKETFEYIYEEICKAEVVSDALTNQIEKIILSGIKKKRKITNIKY